MTESVEVYIEVEVKPTESPEKVKAAVENILSNAEFETREVDGKKFLLARAKGIESLVKLQTILRNDRIRDAARRAISRGATENSLIFYLNKQAAFVKHASFSDPVGESPLGPIKVIINSPDPKGVLDWLAPKTRR